MDFQYGNTVGDRRGTMSSLSVNNSKNPLKPNIESSTRPRSEVVMAQPTPTYRLPPKSPSSTAAGMFLLTTTSRSVVPRKSRRKKRGKTNDRHRRSNEEIQEESLQLLSEGQIDQSLLDPSPDHLNVAADADDLANAADFSMVSFEKAPSPHSVADPLQNLDQNKIQSGRGEANWDSGDSAKIYVQVPSIFRRQKVMCADVASVGNASDTVVSVEDAGRISGRDLHEHAKEVLNEGDYESAVRMFDAIRQAQRARFGEEHPSVGAATHNVGVVRLRMGQAEAAEEILLKAVAIRKRVLGSDHLDLAASLTKLGSARVVLHKFSHALQDLREALRITRKAFGRCHKTVAQILCHVACLYFEAGELISAQSTFEDALEIYRDIFPYELDRDSCMAQMTETLCNIGSIKNKRKNFSDAIDSFREALDLQRGIMGHNHPRVIATLDNLGYSFSKNKNYNQALTCYKEMMNAQLSRLGVFTMDCCETLKKQIIIYEKLNSLDGAVRTTEKSLERLKKESRPPGDPVILEVEQILFDLERKRESRRSEF